MKVSRAVALMAMTGLSAPLLAASAPTVGKVTAASQGTFVSRGGKLISARPGQALYAGDRVLTRSNANARVAMSGCSYTLGSTSILSLGKGSCSAAPKSLAVQDNNDDRDASGAPIDGANGTSGGTVVVAIAAAAAVAAGIYVLVEENDSSPASP